MQKRAVIIGAGIGGLAAGLSLKQAGFKVHVFERHPQLRTSGVGLNIWPNGARVLYALGLREKFNSIANFLTNYKTYSSTGEILGEEDLAAYRDRYSAPVSGVYRKELSQMMASALGEENISFEHESTEIEDDGHQVTCHFRNGKSIKSDILIGADGIHSIIRTKLFGHQHFNHDEHIRWRGLFNVDDAGVDPQTQADVIGLNGHIGWLPIGRGLAYWYAAGEGFEDKSELLDYFGSWAETPIPRLLRATAKNAIIRNVITDFEKPLKHWGRGRVTLLGDAAHPMLPGIAQGANQALMDVATLSDKLKDAADLETALRSYEAARSGPANRVTKASRSLFEYDTQLDKFTTSHANPLFRNYEYIVEKDLVH